MENPTPTTSSTHPMIIVAATSVTIASLAGVAFLAGWLPVQQNNAAPTAQVASAPATRPGTAPEKAAPLNTQPGSKVAVQSGNNAPIRQTAPRQTSKPSSGYAPGTYDNPGYDSRGATTVSSAPMNDSGVYVENSRAQQQYSNNCRDCGTIQSVREVKQDGEGTGLGAVGGGVVGGLLGNQIGGGRGKTLGAVVGAVGGAYAGHEIEKNVRSTKSYEITVHLDDGNTRVFSEPQLPAFHDGDRVRVTNGQLSRM